MITYYVITNGLDSLRAIVGPLPSFLCEIVVFFKNFIHCNVAQFTLAITVTKYAFVRIYKCIPTIDDSFIATGGYPNL